MIEKSALQYFSMGQKKIVSQFCCRNPLMAESKGRVNWTLRVYKVRTRLEAEYIVGANCLSRGQVL